MEPEQQVINRDLAEQMDKLGFDQDSHFWWFEHPESDCWFVGDG